MSTEPTNAEIAAKIDTLVTAMGALAGEMRAGFRKNIDRIDALDRRVGRVESEMDAQFKIVGNKIDQLREDVTGPKVDTAYAERYINDLQEAMRRHVDELHGNAA